MSLDLRTLTLSPSLPAFFRFRQVGDKVIISNYEGEWLALTQDEFRQFAEGAVPEGSPLHARLDDPSGPSDKSLQYAVSLLEGRDPATVVATLLELAEPPLTREPMEIPAVVEERPWTPADANRRPRPYRPRPHRGAAPRRARRDGSDRRA